MNCKEVLEILSSEADLDPAKKEAIDEHMKGCEPCRTLREELARHDEVSPGDADYVQDPPALQKKIKDRAHVELDRRPRAKTSPGRILVLVGMAAAGVLGGVMLDRNMRTPTITVTPEDEWVRLDGRNLDLQAAELLERHGRHEQAVILARHALDSGKLTDIEQRQAEAIVGKK